MEAGDASSTRALAKASTALHSHRWQFKFDPLQLSSKPVLAPPKLVPCAGRPSSRFSPMRSCLRTSLRSPSCPATHPDLCLSVRQDSIALDQRADPVHPTGRWRLLVPSQAPAVGTWRIDYNLSCPQDSSSRSYALAIGPNAQLPTTIGAIASTHQTQCQTLFDVFRPNGATGFVDKVGFELTVSPELTPWLPITAFTVQHKTASFFGGDYGAAPDSCR